MEEPEKSPNCIVDPYGIFVDPTNSDDAKPGTKAAPVKTITAALGKLRGRKRIYLRDGTLDEHVKLRTAVSLFGGFACQTWTYNAKRVRVAPQDPGYALRVDMDFTALGGTPTSPSSVAAFSYNTPSLTLRRIALTAQNGAKGAGGLAGSIGLLATSAPIAGTPNAETAPEVSGISQAFARGQTCTCSTGGTSSGGDGGKNAFAAGRTGKNGTPAQAVPTPAGADGVGVATGSE